MSKRDFRTVNMTEGQMVESDKVLKRIGDVNYRNIGALSKILYDSNGLMVSSGLTVAPVSGMQVSVSEGKGIQGTENANFPFIMTAAQTLTLEAASGAARIDIIEMQVQSRSIKNDFSKAIVDPSTGEITTQSIKRDIQYFPAFRVRTGTTSATAATAGTLTGSVSIVSTVDLSTKYLLNICDGEDGEFVEVNIQGATPEATTKSEIVAKINAAIGRSIASVSGNYIVLTGNGTGDTSYFELKPPTSNSSLDALSVVFGLSSSGVYNYNYRGVNEWIKICEIDVGTATTTITSSMIRDILQKTTWASGSTRIEFCESIEKSSNGNLLPITLSSSNKILSGLEARHDGFILSGTLTANVNLVVPNTVRPYQIINNCTGAYTVTAKTASGTGVNSYPGDAADVYCDGVNVVKMPVNANKLGGYSAGNATGNIPLNNNVENAGLWAQSARGLRARNTSASESILDMVVTDFTAYGYGVYYYTITNTDAASPWGNTSRAYSFGGSINSKLLAYQYNSKASAVRNRVNGVWDTEWTYLTDGNGNAVNAVNANSLGGVAAASYAPYIDPTAAVLQGGSLTANSPVTANFSGFVVVNISTSSSATYCNLLIGSVGVAQDNNPGINNATIFTVRIKAGQSFTVRSDGLSSGTYYIRSAII